MIWWLRWIDENVDVVVELFCIITGSSFVKKVRYSFSSVQTNAGSFLLWNSLYIVGSEFGNFVSLENIFLICLVFIGKIVLEFKYAY